jgi:siroheme decarboxylase
VDKIDTQLLNLIQRTFPITERPYLALAEELGIVVQEVIDRIRELRANGFIRSISAIFDPAHLNMKSALVAVRIAPNQLEEIAQVISAFPEVTHSYGRDDEFNLWFTITARSDTRLREIVAAVEKLDGAKQVAVLPTLRKFKLQVQFDADAGVGE